MTQLPKWAVVALTVLLAGAAVVAIFSSYRRLQTDRQARKMLDQGKLQLGLSKADTEAIVAEIRRSAGK